MRKLAILTTHPIQYYAPVFKLIHHRGNIDIKIFYSWGETSLDKYDPGFGKKVSWDVDLLEGYPFEWVENVAAHPGSHHYKGIIAPKLINQIKAYGPDALLVFGWAYQAHLNALRYFKNRIPVYFRGDSTLLDEQHGLKAFAKTLFLKWIYRHVNYVFYTGSNNRAYFKKYGLRDQQLTFAPHAIDNERFATNRNPGAQQLRIDLNVNNDDLLILFAAKFEDKKGPMLLLKAFMELDDPRLHLLMVGNGKLESELKKAASGIPNIHFVDFQNQSYMPVVYQAADLFCLPSKGPQETWGLAVNEAMASCRAILVSDKAGCAADLVKPGENGLIFRHADADSLKSALQQLTGSKAGLKHMGDRSAQLIKNWNFEKIAEAIENQLMSENKT